MFRSSCTPRLILLVALAATLGLAGCKKPRKKPVRTKDQMKRIAAAVLKEAPKPQIPLGADFDGKVELLGIDLIPLSVAQGGSAPFSVSSTMLAATIGCGSVDASTSRITGMRIIEGISDDERHAPVGPGPPATRYSSRGGE